MRYRSLLILVLGLLAGGALLAVSYFAGRSLCTYRMAQNTDELDWLRREFSLNDSEMQRIRQLHEGYRPQCMENCAKIALCKAELQKLLSSGSISAETEQKIVELAQLRAHCQTQMLRHFQEVSQAMPPDQGRRYLAEMERVTLGFHEQIEKSMSADPASTHGQHHH